MTAPMPPRPPKAPTRPEGWLRRVIAKADALAAAVDGTEMDASIQTGCAARRPTDGRPRR